MAPKVFSNDSFHFASLKTGRIANAFILRRCIKKLIICPIQNNNPSDKIKKPITVHQSRLWLMYQIDKIPNNAATR